MRRTMIACLAVTAQLVLIASQAHSATQGKSIRNYIFGHSLINHGAPNPRPPSDETTVPHWLHFLARAGGNKYAADGQFGYLPQHAQLPPRSQWSFKHVRGVWKSESSIPFARSRFNTILMTPLNYIQYKPATEPYDWNNPDKETPLGATLKIIDWLDEQIPGIDIYIYESWPSIEAVTKSFPPSREELEKYHKFTQETFRKWWMDYLAEIESARPDANVKLIPVGPMISKVLTKTNLREIPVTDLYEDNAPHGRPTIYFLAALVTYMEMYGEKAPEKFKVPRTVHNLVRDNYQDVVDFIWSELKAPAH